MTRRVPASLEVSAMRPRVTIPVLVFGAFLLAGFLLLRQKQPAPANDHQASPVLDGSSGTASEDSGASANSRPKLMIMKPPRSLAAAAEAPPAGEAAEETPEEIQRAYAETRSSELMDLAMNDDPDSLHTILSELANRDPQIRKAAMQAAIQFNSRDAIPALMDAALQTDDPHEKAAIADAIEFLKLPSLDETMAQRKGDGALPPDDASGTNSLR